MRPIGFSTGALAYADFRTGAALTHAAGCPAIELSALRRPELLPMLEALDSLDLKTFSYISIHAPSAIEPEWEAVVCYALRQERWRNWPIVVHPDALHDMSLWREFGPLLCVENMDKRKLEGRTARELARVFDQLPEASLCFDIGHARQCDPTMTEAYLILREFGNRLRQVHVSDVSTRSTHERISYCSTLAFQQVAHLIPDDVPLILETPVTGTQMEEELGKVRLAMPIRQRIMVA